MLATVSGFDSGQYQGTPDALAPAGSVGQRTVRYRFLPPRHNQSTLVTCETKKMNQMIYLRPSKWSSWWPRNIVLLRLDLRVEARDESLVSSSWNQNFPSLSEGGKLLIFFFIFLGGVFLQPQTEVFPGALAALCGRFSLPRDICIGEVISSFRWVT